MQNLMMVTVVHDTIETVEQTVHLLDESSCRLTPAVHATRK